MAINIVVAVTDYAWFQRLKDRRDLTEVNFWSPSAINFRALEPGELFLFKLHAPYNMIVGGGIFAHANTLPSSLAWEAFGEANGATSFWEMRASIAKYRKAEPDSKSDFEIGCRILTQPFFFEESDYLSPPQSFAPNITRFKTYNTQSQEGYELWKAVQDTKARHTTRGIGEDTPAYGTPQLVHPRLGQGGFRVVVTDVYGRRCAVTKERTLPALDAAHIRPFHTGGVHEASNGLLLRKDIHSLFDRGYVTVTPSLDFEVSGSIREEFENGRDYYDLHGTKIIVPGNTDERPDLDKLAWHNENIYRG